MTSDLDVSVVVATRNRPGRLNRLLIALGDQRYPRDRYEVVVVDDASEISTSQVLDGAASSERMALRVLRRDRRGGPALAREEGWRAARGAVIAFTDDDCAPTGDWLAEGMRAVEAHPGAIVQGRTLPDPEEADRLGPFSRTIEVPGPNASFQCCNVFYPREVLERVDGFDTETFARWGGEDADLAWRAIETGVPTAFAGGARVHHAVNELGPLGKLRFAASWDTAMAAYARHDGLRRAHFAHGVFWKPTHYWLLRAVISLLLPARWSVLRNWLAYPYWRSLYARGKLGGNAILAPYFLLDDLAEVSAVVRGAIRFRRLML